MKTVEPLLSTKKAMEDQQPRRRFMNNPQKVLPQVLVAVVGSWGYFCTGTVRGWSSPGVPSLNRTRTFEMETVDFNWISALPMMGSFIGALVIGIPMQLYGRKKALIGHYLLFIAGFLMVASTYFVENKWMLYAGRTVSGVGVGTTTPASQIYVSECSSPRIRGRLGSFTASSMALGILVVYIFGAFCEWQNLAWIFGCVPVIFLVWTAMMPETPIWLLTHGKEEEAKKALRYLRGEKANIDAELQAMKENLEKNSNNDPSKKQIRLRDLLQGPVMKPFGISLGIMFFQQATGANAMIFHTVSIFQQTGSTMDGRYATIVVGFVQLVFTVASGFVVDKFGRRILLLASSSFVSISLVGMGVFFHFQKVWGEHEATMKLGWLPLVSLIVFFIAYSGGMSNVPFIIMGEMFPAQYRTLLGTMSSSFNLVITFLVVRFFPDMLILIGKDWTFYLFTICTLTGIAFVYFLLPETKGKTLEELEKLFASNQEMPLPSSTPSSPAVYSDEAPTQP